MEKLEILFLEHIDQNKGILVKLSRMYMDHLQDQRDLYQEMVYQLWKSYPSFKNQSKFSTWMYQVALNTALAYFKKEKKQLQTESLESRHDIGEEPADYRRDEQLAVFYKAVQELNPVEKALIFLFWKDIATGTSPGI
ncbi:RNA polymerase sigma-70 factor, ECF subfamily [bacterium A37T11]|nr:RNA polymerase sigma-70 factor, ECF subfamily [bacterium A37T11]